jgi:hypothetical protein
MSDTFTTLVTEARLAGQRRDAIYARRAAWRTLAASYSPATVATYSPAYVQRDTLATVATDGAWLASATDKRRKLRLWSQRLTLEGGAYSHASEGTPTVRRAPRTILQHEARWLIAQVRWSATREALAKGEKGGRQKRTDGADGLAAARRNTDGAQTHGAGSWRGLTPVREARHSERGKGGAAWTAKVSMRDAHLPPEVLAPLAHYGHATHPDITDGQSWALLATIAKRRKLATYRSLTRAYVHVATDATTGKRTYGQLTPLALDNGVRPVWPDTDATEAHSGAHVATADTGAGLADTYAKRLAQLGADVDAMRE